MEPRRLVAGISGATDIIVPAAALAARLSAIRGVHGVAVLRVDPTPALPVTFHDLNVGQSGKGIPVPADVVSCAPGASRTRSGCPASPA